MPNLVLIILLAAFPALSTDMYLPAIPTLQDMWGISLAQANLSLVVFFVCFSFFLLVHGPLSDRIGRKPVLVGGVLLYIVGSFACAASGSITQLVLARMAQATGAAAASFLSLALTKDLYEGLDRQKVLALIGVIVPLCPMLAPMLGGWMLGSLSWRWIFICQGTCALAALYGGFRLREPEFERTTGGLGAVVSRYRVLLSNRRYVIYTLVFSIMPTGFFAFIGGSADIYIRDFGLDAQSYGLAFGFNALGMMAGSFACSRLCVGFESWKILKFSLVGLFVGGAGILLGGAASPWIFALPMFVVSFFMGLSRPLANHMTLEEVDTDVGAASAVMTFGLFMFAAVAMEVVSLGLMPKPEFIAALTLVGAVLPMVTLALLGRHERRRARRAEEKE
ncbi:Bcr/CflA family efflux MFS transporter [Desulfovibrio ferrophilus]|uniref:Drug resistance transporter, Bcr/CflA subfamily n=1 Tax=Desulfovibrio ferrophilus TaxID=241368 RepID=A0A2Z6B2N1_9BACT|nr:Bcr/CflA family efflux MFS transporter [Desulfovibrio ferrophilus]BBD09698.1 Drug resistance transporter, Bcr/CflA subfamily [Desulfovibrio ferrophilus]